MARMPVAGFHWPRLSIARLGRCRDLRQGFVPFTAQLQIWQARRTSVQGQVLPAMRRFLAHPLRPPKALQPGHAKVGETVTTTNSN